MLRYAACPVVAREPEFLGPAAIAVKGVVGFIGDGLVSLGLALSSHKTRVRSRSQMPTVCGLRVDQNRLLVPQARRNEVDGEVRRLARYGGSEAAMQSARGKIEALAPFHPAHARALMEILAASPTRPVPLHG